MFTTDTWGKYESERLKYARDLINFDKKWSKMFSDKPQTEDNHGGVSHEEFLGCVPRDHATMLGTSDNQFPSSEC